MQVTRINTNMNFNAKLSPEFRNKMECLGNYLIDRGRKEEFDKFEENLTIIKELYPDRTIEIIPFMEQKQLRIWEYNKGNQRSTREEEKFFPNAHKTEQFILLPVLNKMVALTHPSKKPILLLSKPINFNDRIISSDRVSEIRETLDRFDRAETLNKKSKSLFAKAEEKKQEERLKKLLYT